LREQNDPPTNTPSAIVSFQANRHDND
jgi:hypothetical protein